jgi:CubicO group peptidase (beta-lactamase class C family)
VPNPTLSLALLALIATPLAAQRDKPPAGWVGFTKRVAAYVDTNRIVGAGAVLVRDGKIVARYNVGFADKSAGRRVDDRTLFHYGSITKTLASITVMQLRDRGKLSLDDPITKWIPELRQVHDPFGSIDSVTLRMLLSHTAGFQNPTWPYTEGQAWEPFEPTTWGQLVAMMPYQELHFKPGSRYSYSNPGFIYLARVVEIITGEPWVSYVQKNLFAPLGMTRSYFSTTPYHLTGDRSHGYDVNVDSATQQDVVVDHGADFDPGITIPNGGWNAPLDDLAAYLAFLTGAAADTATQRRYDVVLSRKSLEEMWRPQRNSAVFSDSSGHRRDMGLGFMVDRDAGYYDVGHTGTQGGYEAFLHFNPQNRTGFVLVFNTTYHDSVVGRAPSFYNEMMTAAWALIH